MDDFNWVALMVALVGGGGVGVAIREVVSVVTLARQGVSGKEDRRRSDIVSQRDWALSERDKALTERDKALSEKEAAEAAEDARARHGRVLEESLLVHRRVIIEASCLGPEHLPPYPSRKD